MHPKVDFIVISKNAHEALYSNFRLDKSLTYVAIWSRVWIHADNVLLKISRGRTFHKLIAIATYYTVDWLPAIVFGCVYLAGHWLYFPGLFNRSSCFPDQYSVMH